MMKLMGLAAVFTCGFITQALAADLPARKTAADCVKISIFRPEVDKAKSMVQLTINGILPKDLAVCNGDSEESDVSAIGNSESMPDASRVTVHTSIDGIAVILVPAHVQNVEVSAGVCDADGKPKLFLAHWYEVAPPEELHLRRTHIFDEKDGIDKCAAARAAQNTTDVPAK